MKKSVLYGNLDQYIISGMGRAPETEQCHRLVQLSSLVKPMSMMVLGYSLEQPVLFITIVKFYFHPLLLFCYFINMIGSIDKVRPEEKNDFKGV